MKTLIKYLVLGSISIFVLFQLNSCRKDFSIDEFEKMKNDSLNISGDFAGSLINSDLTLGDFIPESDSTFWIEIDNDNLLHIRIYKDNYFVYTMDGIFSLTYPLSGGDPVPAGSQQLNGDTANLKINEKMSAGLIYFSDPIITFIIENEIPLISFFQMDDFTLFDQDTVPLDNASHPAVTINAPAATGTSALTEVTITSAEIPLLSDMFSPIPKLYSFSATVGSSSAQNIPLGYGTDEVTGQESMYIDIDYDFPVDIRLEELVMGDTANLDMTSDMFNMVNEAEIKIKFQNGFPIDAFSQIYFISTDTITNIVTVIDSVFTDVSHSLITDEGWNLESAETGVSGVVTEPTESIVTVIIEKDKLRKLIDNNSTRIAIKGKLSSYDYGSGTFVKILSTYSMGVQIAIKANIETSTNNF